MNEVVEPVSNSTVSVVLPVHGGLAADHLTRALRSLEEQSEPPHEIIVVEDGPLPVSLQRALSAHAAISPITRRVRLATNQGAGAANDRGLREARGTWIAKMDADDVALPQRIERQHQLAEGLDVDVLGAAMAEFDGDETHITRIRHAPGSHEAIVRRMPWNNPINHPTAFYRREAALAAGGYPHLRYLQDYGLFARMLAFGATMYNDDDPVVLFRADAPCCNDARREQSCRVSSRSSASSRSVG